MKRFHSVCNRVFLFVFLSVGTVVPARSQSPQFSIGIQVERNAMGAKVVAVSPGSPAERAGLHAGDVILSVNNTPMHNLDIDAIAAAIRGPRDSAVRLMIMSANGTGRTIQVTRGLETPALLQRPISGASTDVSATPPVMPNQGATTSASSGNVPFASWTEPKEHAFTVDVPRGWQIVGGVSWHSQTDAQQFIRATSPDGKVQIFVGDPDLLPRQVPNQLLRVFGGAKEGQQYPLPTGGVAVWSRYATGSQAAQQHIAARRLCQNARTVWSSDLREESSSLTETLAPKGREFGAIVTASAGDVGFLCDDAQGYVYAATVLASSSNNSVQVWGVLKLAGFVSTDPMQSMQARYITEHMLATMKSDPAWDQALEDQNRRITGSYISMQNAALAVQNNAARSASNDLSRLNHPNAGVSARAGATRSSSTNTIMGTRDVCDAIGRCKTVSNDAETVFMDHSGNVRAGRAGGAPPDNSGVWSPTYSRP